MPHWNDRAPEPDWVKLMTDQDVVEKFQAEVFRRQFTHEQAGRSVRGMRHRLLKILLDGLAAQQQAKLPCAASPFAKQQDDN